MSAAIATEDLERTANTPVDWLPGYELLSVLGSGAFGTVFKALQLKLERVVAVKVITVDEEAHPNLAARFEAEALTHGKLRHPNIVQVFDRGRHAERLYITMEMLDGEDLGNRLQKSGPLPPHVAWAIARQTASALAHAHTHDVVHRDIKPANLFLVPAPSGLGLARDVPLVKVTDFGLAFTRQAAAGKSEPRLTANNMLLGTPVYMAPEQYRHAPDLDHRADIYSLGATVAHMLTGKPPFDGPTVWDVMVQKLEHGPKLDAIDDLPSRRLILDMMATDAKDRPATYEALIARIDELSATVPRPTPKPQRKPRRWLVWGGVLALAGIVLAPALFPPRHPSNDPSDFVTSGVHASLFDGESLAGWLPPASGGAWRLGADDEGDAVLAGTGFTRRTFAAHDYYRVILGLDPHRATATEVHFALPAAAPETGPRLVLRVTGEGARLGTRRGDKGTFAPLDGAEAVPMPPSEWFAQRKPYLEVRLQFTGDEWQVWFNGQFAGRADGRPDHARELRLFADGGPARVNTVELTSLRKE